LVLGFIVLIRTFLSLSLQVELEGRFPWQKEKSPQGAQRVNQKLYNENSDNLNPSPDLDP
ncbi:hypothetical protein ACS8FD_18695, partial [Psychrobacter sp. 1U2]